MRHSSGPPRTYSASSGYVGWEPLTLSGPNSGLWKSESSQNLEPQILKKIFRQRLQYDTAAQNCSNFVPPNVVGECKEEQYLVT